MSRIAKAEIWIFVIAVITIALVYWFFGALWSGVDVSPARNYSSLPEPAYGWFVRGQADKIIAGRYTPTAWELNSIITTLAYFGEDHDPDKLRIQQLQEIRNRFDDSDMPGDTTPDKP